MKSDFKPEELVSKGGRTYPVVGGRLRVAHEDNECLSIATELVEYQVLSHAAVKATVSSDKGLFSAYGCASVTKDERLADSLLELAETRAIARALRFSGYGVEFTGVEEIGSVEDSKSPYRAKPVPMSKEADFRNKEQGGSFAQNSSAPFAKEQGPALTKSTSATKQATFTPATRPQLHAIEKIATLNRWNPVECCRKILHSDVISLEALSKEQASEVIGRMKGAA